MISQVADTWGVFFMLKVVELRKKLKNNFQNSSKRNMFFMFFLCLLANILKEQSIEVKEYYLINQIK